MLTPRNPYFRLLIILTAVVLLGILVAVGETLAQDEAPAAPPVGGSPMHPTFPLLDATGQNVLDAGTAVSTMQTCGACHDTEFIANHSFHADAGLGEFGAAGSVANGRAWDTSPGLFGKWSPLTYRYLSPQGDGVVDLTTPEWLQTVGVRHAGGGPAVSSREGLPLVSLAAEAGNVETAVINPITGQTEVWNWAESGTVEMNCFLCHTPQPDNAARTATLQAGQFGWANTATLAQTGLVTRTVDGWTWNAAAFDEAGHARLAVQDPTNDNCGACHGLVHMDNATPLTLNDLAAGDFSTLTTGQVMSPQKISQSGLNISGKGELARSWDIHTERVLQCTDCHYSLNNPIYYLEADANRPDYLVFDPRRIDIGDYLYRPLHQFAKGNSAQGTLAPELDNSLRRCESCHSIEATHNWLPFKEAHITAVSCESCHIPTLYAPALEYVDWTVLQSDGTPAIAYRGVMGEELSPTTLIEGYQPVLLPRAEANGQTRLSPFNLISAWYWVAGSPERPVPQATLTAAWLDGDGYQPEMLAAFDSDSDGQLSAAELVIDTEAKATAVTNRLIALGLENPRIVGEVEPYSINHNVATDDWVSRDCRDCHSDDSRLAQPFTLSDRTPGGVTPTFVAGGPVSLTGEIVAGENGRLHFQPRTEEAGLYVLGHNAVRIVDWIGILMFLGVLAGVTLHGGLRYRAARKAAHEHRHEETAVAEVYMYDVYERLWHWLQTLTILLLLFTGLIIHKPDMFGMFSFSYVVQVHNILAVILIINAALSLFYHLASGEIKQYLPQPVGLFDQVVVQAKYYLGGIFRGEAHPFEKTRESKLNPLQQITYFGILNVLLPLQIITGVLMWGAQRWPEAAARFGGLPILGPFHSLIAWTFASFIVMHVYLTTTGHRPTAAIKAMMLGWDEVEVGAEAGVQAGD
jgi:thiosulfate reductase cytochrome b subunit